jgi:hypothetical protein
MTTHLICAVHGYLHTHSPSKHRRSILDQCRRMPGDPVRASSPHGYTGSETMENTPGRNAPCPCGSGLKFKKCCLDKQVRPAAVTQPGTPPMARLSSSELAALNGRMREEFERRRRFGNVRPMITAVHQGHRFVAVGSRLYFHEQWNTFTDFLLFYVRDVMGREWWKGAASKQGYERHTEQQFRDITRTPAWAGGQYDGRIRIPVAGASQQPELFKRVLTHELTHAIVAGIAPAGVSVIAERPAFGWTRLLHQLADGQSFEDVLGSFGFSYADLEASFAR